jgi:CheY-like chemotaxis protein
MGNITALDGENISEARVIVPGLLVAEDNPVNLRLMQGYLERYFRDVIIKGVDNPEDAITAIQKALLKWIAIITDWDMRADNDGLDVLREAVAWRIPVVVHTGDPDRAIDVIRESNISDNVHIIDKREGKMEIHDIQSAVDETHELLVLVLEKGGKDVFSTINGLIQLLLVRLEEILERASA